MFLISCLVSLLNKGYLSMSRKSNNGSTLIAAPRTAEDPLKFQDKMKY